MTSLESYKKKLLELKKIQGKSTQGEVEIFRMDGLCGYFNFMAEIPFASSENHIIAHFSEADNHNSRNNAYFFKAAANTYDQLLSDLLSCVEALEFTKDLSQRWDEYPCNRIFDKSSNALANLKLGVEK